MKSLISFKKVFDTLYLTITSKFYYEIEQYCLLKECSSSHSIFWRNQLSALQSNRKQIYDSSTTTNPILAHCHELAQTCSGKTLAYILPATFI